jgi:hypothetical protein
MPTIEFVGLGAGLLCPLFVTGGGRSVEERAVFSNSRVIIYWIKDSDIGG